MGSFEKKFSTTTTRYVIDGQEYDSLDDVPQQFRKFLADKDRDGRPDWVEDEMQRLRSYPTGRVEVRAVNGATTYKIGDQQYNSLEELSQPYRALPEDRDGDGVPDLFDQVPRPGSGSLRDKFPQAFNALAGRTRAEPGPREEAIDAIVLDDPPQSSSDSEIQRPRRRAEPIEKVPYRDPGHDRDLEFGGESSGGAVFLLMLFVPPVVIVALLGLYLSGLLGN